MPGASFGGTEVEIEVSKDKDGDKRPVPTNLPNRIESFAARAFTDSLEEAEFVHDLMRFKAGLLKTSPSPPARAEPTIKALRRQADTLYTMATT